MQKQRYQQVVRSTMVLSLTELISKISLKKRFRSKPAHIGVSFPVNPPFSELFVMKEVEKNEIKRLSDRLDLIRHQMADLSLVDAAEKYAELEKESVKLEAEIERLREVKGQKLSKEAQKLMNMPHRRAITKKSRPTWAS